MTELSNLADRVRAEFPDIQLEVDDAVGSEPSGFCAFRKGSYRLDVEFRRGMGFGLRGGKEATFGEGPHEVYRDAEDALNRVLVLLRRSEVTAAPDELVLAKLRHLRGLSQEEVASRLRLRQASVSKIERRPDMHLSTLDKFIRAMGGTLELTARFPDTTIKVSAVRDLSKVVAERTTRRKKRARRLPSRRLVTRR